MCKSIIECSSDVLIRIDVANIQSSLIDTLQSSLHIIVTPPVDAKLFPMVTLEFVETVITPEHLHYHLT